MKPLISIIIPIFNEKLTITTTIQSILKQSYTNFEIIIVDNASIDSSLKIMEKLRKKDKRIKIISTNGQGKSYSRNLGIKNSNRRIYNVFWSWTYYGRYLIRYYHESCHYL